MPSPVKLNRNGIVTVIVISIVLIGYFLHPTYPTSRLSSSSPGHLPRSTFHFPADFPLPLDSDLVHSQRKHFKEVVVDAHVTKNREGLEEYGHEATLLKEVPFTRRSLLRHLFTSFAAFAKEREFVFWLAHGTLLGQHWGEAIMTHDADLDVQTSFHQLHKVVAHSQTLYEGRFVLDVNPLYLVRFSSNTYKPLSEKNVIDARWIDVLTGVFIDITVLSYLAADFPGFNYVVGSESSLVEAIQATNYTLPSDSSLPNITTTQYPATHSNATLHDKSPREYGLSQILPLQRCKFESVDVFCPNKKDDILLAEYPHYQELSFGMYRYDEQRKFFRIRTCTDIMEMYARPTSTNCDSECRDIVSHRRELHWLPRGKGDKFSSCKLKVTYWKGVEGAAHDERKSKVYEGDASTLRLVPMDVEKTAGKTHSARKGWGHEMPVLPEGVLEPWPSELMGGAG